MKKIKRFLLLLFAFGYGLPLLAQSIGPISITSSQCASISTDQKGAIGIQVTGTWSGTLQPEVSVAGQASQDIQVTPSTSSTAQSTITANGIYYANVAGYSTALVCGSTVATGTAVVYLNVSNASARTLGGAAGALLATTISDASFTPRVMYNIPSWWLRPSQLTATNSFNSGSFIDYWQTSYWTGTAAANDYWQLETAALSGSDPNIDFFVTHQNSFGTPSSGLHRVILNPTGDLFNDDSSHLPCIVCLEAYASVASDSTSTLQFGFRDDNNTNDFLTIITDPTGGGAARVDWSLRGLLSGSPIGAIYYDNSSNLWLGGPNAESTSSGGGLEIVEATKAVIAFGNFTAPKVFTTSNCASGASPAVCGSASSGSIAVAAGTNPTLVVDTSAVTASSVILLTEDESLGTKLSVTCNTATIPTGTFITARSAGTSFTLQINGTFTTNPVCYNYVILN